MAVALGIAVAGGLVAVGAVVFVAVAADKVFTTCVGVEVRVSVGKMIETGVKVTVAVARGVRVLAILGTARICPTTMLYW